MSIVFVIIGAVLVLWGADRLTDGATALAVKLNIPQIVIGLTVVAFGTSMPEFFVSMTSAVKGRHGIGKYRGFKHFQHLDDRGCVGSRCPDDHQQEYRQERHAFRHGSSLDADGDVSRQ